MNERFQATGTSSGTSPGVEARRTMRRFHLKKKVGIAIASLTAFLLAPAISASAPAAADEQHVGPSAPAAVVEANDRRAHAAVVNPEPFEVRQPDGTRSHRGRVGRRTDARLHDPERARRRPGRLGGVAIRRPAGQGGCPAALCPRGGKGCSTIRREAAARRRLRRTAEASRTHDPGSPGTGLGKQPALVILVSFTDRAPVGSTESSWADHFFGAGKSVATYYRQNSFNAFRLVPAAETSGAKRNGVVGWLELPFAHPNYKGAIDSSREVQAASSRPQGGGSLRELSVLRHGS